MKYKRLNERQRKEIGEVVRQIEVIDREIKMIDQVLEGVPTHPHNRYLAEEYQMRLRRLRQEKDMLEDLL